MSDIQKLLQPVCQRIRLQAALQSAAVALRWSAVAAVCLGLLRLCTGGWLIPWVALAAVVIATITAGLLRWLTPNNYSGAARKVDNKFDLQDRTITALEANEHQDKAIWRMQQNEAAQHLSKHPLKTAAPLATPAGLPATAAILTIALALLFWPLNMFQHGYENIPAPAPYNIAAPAVPSDPGVALQVDSGEESVDPQRTNGNAVENYFGALAAGKE